MRLSVISWVLYCLISWAPSIAASSAGGGDRTGALTRDRALELALTHSPVLASAAAAMKAAEGALVLAGAFQNPELTLEKEDFGGDLGGSGQSQTTLGVAQPLEITGARRAREDAARADAEAARWAVEAVRLDLVREVDHAFASALGAQETLRLAGENAAAARAMAEAVTALAAAGEVSAIEASRASNEAALAEVDERRARTDLAIALQALAAVVGLKGADFQRIEGHLPEAGDAEISPVPPEPPAVMPDLALVEAGRAAGEARVREARAARWPVPTLSAGYREYASTGEHAYVAGLSISLPIFNAGRGAVAEAETRLEQAQADLRGEEVRLWAAGEEALRRWEQAREEAEALRSRILPQAREVYAAVNEGYIRGKFSLLDLLEARRALAGAGLREVEARVRLAQAQADVARYAPGRLTIKTEGGRIRE
jgi:cobalt-zinc-cadmium efflux system outer membrane protein